MKGNVVDNFITQATSPNLLQPHNTADFFYAASMYTGPTFLFQRADSPKREWVIANNNNMSLLSAGWEGAVSCNFSLLLWGGSGGGGGGVDGCFTTVTGRVSLCLPNSCGFGRIYVRFWTCVSTVCSNNSFNLCCESSTRQTWRISTPRLSSPRTHCKSCRICRMDVTTQ